MTNATIIDTDILIDFGRGVSEAVNCLQKLQSNYRLIVSIVTQMELIVGCANKLELQALEKFLLRFDIIKIDPTISEQAVELLAMYRLSHGLLIADSLIAATAITWDYSLITKNQRDYRFIPTLNLLPYP
ncbi:type II toxin-antitoxin system VapC family toxin [Euhalothece natronophila Z-M001]|uniref:Type II toxin-antitoxin system VapC family toxin n=1 Tax=Euhalothece natronophila Z-M001 TaxID=522448 RepID=A0A5B8NNR7_9CHRO|nr:type II toxin-antitoxin system VapC family toxin [Euhalothece natronophila]QDZ40933.1 type II toxin-antitoxin system VapC family toxin [Euhalothece natronophila Z-M001]